MLESAAAEPFENRDEIVEEIEFHRFLSASLGLVADAEAEEVEQHESEFADEPQQRLVAAEREQLAADHRPFEPERSASVAEEYACLLACPYADSTLGSMAAVAQRRKREYADS